MTTNKTPFGPFADREVNAATGTIRIAGFFPNPNNLLRPGGYGRVRLSVRTEAGAKLVPQRATVVTVVAGKSPQTEK